jgi:carboxyl-terminal processing protease
MTTESDADIDGPPSQYIMALGLCYILAMEVARQLEESAVRYDRWWLNKKFAIGAAIVILGAAIFGGTIGDGRRLGNFTSANAGDSSRIADEIENDYNEAIGAITGNYAGDIDHEKATQAAIQGMLSTLDPHSLYFPYNEFKKLKEDQDSRFYGIGVTIVQHRDGVYIQSAVDGTPAARHGLRYGDRILEVDGKNARDWSSEQVSKNVRGALGEPVTIKVERAGSEAPLYFTIVRAAVPLPTIRNSYLIRPGTGYIGLTGGFQRSSDDELAKAMKRLEEQGMRQLILDLRGNPGGLLDQAVKVSDVFLAHGLIVYTEGREEGSAMKFSAHQAGTEPDYPMVVLINGGSASAADIVAGALQDQKRAVLLGTQRFGKGSVQTVIPLSDSSGLRLTTARYYTPAGTSIQAKGITPDIEVRPMELREVEEEKRLRESDLAKHIEAPPATPREDLPPNHKVQPDGQAQEDYQLLRALDLLKGFLIMQDIGRPAA